MKLLKPIPLLEVPAIYMPLDVEFRNRISRFQGEMRSLGGQSHLARTPLEVANLVLEIVLNAKCKLAIIDSCIDNDDKIRSTLTKHGVDTIRIRDTQATLECLSKADVGITHADMAVSQTATVIIKTSRDEERLVSCLPRIHIAILNVSRLVEKLTDAAQFLQTSLQTNEPCVISFVSGPSRTSDIEMKQILGVHGPHEVHVVLLED